MNYKYKFPVVKGIQAGNVYFIAMIPLKMLIKLFNVDDCYVLPEYRAQRKINEARIPEIKKYILNNKKSYVFSALAASVDGNINFISSDGGDTGILEVDMDSKFLINDGQHRKAAILEALQEDSSLGNETISIVLYTDLGLKRSQQIFTDLNKYAVRTSNSISELYDSRDKLAVYTRKIISEIPFLNEYVDKERDILGKYSSSLFTLNNFYTANKKIIGKNDCIEEDYQFLKKFWKLITKNMTPWNDFLKKEISKKDLRENYIVTQSVVIQGLSRVGVTLFNNKDYKLEDFLPNISNINWKRTNTEWYLRAIGPNGRIINNSTSIMLIGNVIKKYIGLKLNHDEKLKEKTMYLKN